MKTSRLRLPWPDIAAVSRGLLGVLAISAVALHPLAIGDVPDAVGSLELLAA